MHDRPRERAVRLAKNPPAHAGGSDLPQTSGTKSRERENYATKIMEDGTWKKAKEIFGDALELAPEKRAVFPDKICADDKLLRCEVEILLNSFEKAGSDFMEQGQSERWRR